MGEINRAFDEMRKVARGWLEGGDPRAIANRSGLCWDEKRLEFVLMSLGREVRISWPNCEIVGALGDWHELLLLHYMHLADGAPLGAEWIGFSQLRDGMVRGGGFDRDGAERLSRMLGGRAPEDVERACRALGGEMLETNADCAFVFSILPRFPILMKLWFADDEFPASAKLLLRGGADHYLTVEDAVTAGEVLLSALEAQFEE